MFGFFRAETPSEKRKERTVTKAATMSAVVGAAIWSIKNPSQVASWAGQAVKYISDNSQSLMSASRSAVRGLGGEPLARRIFSNEFLDITDGLDQIATQSTSSLSAEREVAVMENLVAHVDPTGKHKQRVLDALAPVRSVLRDVFTATDAESALNTLNSGKTMDQVSQALRQANKSLVGVEGIRRMPTGQSSIKPYLASSIKAEFDAAPSKLKDARSAFILNSKHGIKNINTITNAVTEAADDTAKKNQFLRDLAEASGLDSIKVSNIATENEHGRLVLNEAGQKLQARIAKQHKGSETFISDQLEKFNRSLDKVFGEKPGSGAVGDAVGEAKAKLRSSLLNRDLGIYTDKNDNLVMVDAIKKQTQRKMKNVMEELSVPLLPGFFDVRLSRLFGFMKQSTRTFHNLGYTNAQPEHLKVLTKSGTINSPEYSTLMKAGQNILEFDARAGTISKTDYKANVVLKRGNLTGAEMARVRALEDKPIEGEGLQMLKNYLRGETIDSDKLRNLVLTHQDKLFDITLDGETLNVAPKPVLHDLGLGKLSMDRLLKDNILQISDLSANTLEGLVTTTKTKSGHMLRMVQQEYLDIALEGQRSIKSELLELLNREGGDHQHILKGIAERLDSPEELLDFILTNDDLQDDSRFLLSNTDLFSAIEQFKNDPDALIKTDPGHSAMQRFIEGFTGEVTPSKVRTDIENAILQTHMGDYGSVPFNEDRAQHIGDVREWIMNRFIIPNSKNWNKHQQEYVFNRLLVSEADRSPGVSSGLASVIQTRGYDPSHASEISDDLFARAVALKARAEVVYYDTMQNSLMSPLNEISDNLDRMARDKKVADHIRNTTRGRGTKGHFSDTSITAGSDYLVLPKNPEGASFWDANIRPLFDSESPMSYANYIVTSVGQMANETAAKVGLGLPGQDRKSLLRYAISTYTKRVLPIQVASEVYNNINADAETYGLPGLDDALGNVVGNAALLRASLLDGVGLTGTLKDLTNTYPVFGLYGTPRTREEEEQNLAYGSSPVRRSRFWAIGSRTPFTGEYIEHYKPNMFRMLRSDWKTAENAQIVNPNYSFLPTLTNPLAPLNLLKDKLTPGPNWWLRAQKYHRPYIDNGLGLIEDHEAGMSFERRKPGEELMIGFSGHTGQMSVGTMGTGIGGLGGGSGGGMGSGGGTGGGSEPQFYPVPVRYFPDHTNVSPHMFKDAYNSVASMYQTYQNQGGLYGAILKMNPFAPKEIRGPHRQDPSQVRDFRRFLFGNSLGELSGMTGEYYRRLFGFYQTDKYGSSPFKNDMPTWVPSQYSKGDPYMRESGYGELILPGEAFEKVNPWVKRYTKKAVYNFLLRSSGRADEESQEAGIDIHRMVQSNLSEQGSLIQAEVPVYDDENNVFGTVDAIVNGVSGPTVVEIKSQNAAAFRDQENPEEYLTQLNNYMGMTGLSQGMILFVNSEDLTQTRTVQMEFDPAQFEQGMEELNKSREQIIGMVNSHQLSPYELYEPLARFQVLSKAAPNSAEARSLYRKFKDGSVPLTPQHSIIFDTIEKEYKAALRRYNTSPSMRNISTKPIEGVVLGFGRGGEIITDKGTFRLAGVDFTRTALNSNNPENIYADYGIHVGKRATFHINSGTDLDSLQGEVISAVISGVNRSLMDSHLAKPLENSPDPLDRRAAFGDANPVAEYLLHTDNIITNKWLRSRTALEQYKRGEIYGTDFASWSDPIDTMLMPTIRAFVAKDPLSASIQMGLTSSLFVKTPGMKLKVGRNAAAVAGILSILNRTREIVNASPWIPEPAKRGQEIEDYYEALDYIKQSSIYKATRQRLYLDSGVNIDLYETGITSESISASKSAIVAIEAKRKLESNRFAIDMAKATLSEAIETLPGRKQQLAYEVAMYGSKEEQSEFYKLLSESEQQVMAKFLNQRVNKRTGRPYEYSVEHALRNSQVPDAKWVGWNPSVQLDAVQRFAHEFEDLPLERPRSGDLDAVTYEGREAQVYLPKMGYPPQDVKRFIRNLSQDMGDNLSLNVLFTDRPSPSIEVDMDTTIDMSEVPINYMEQEARTLSF